MAARSDISEAGSLQSLKLSHNESPSVSFSKDHDLQSTRLQVLLFDRECDPPVSRWCHTAELSTKVNGWISKFPDLGVAPAPVLPPAPPSRSQLDDTPNWYSEPSGSTSLLTYSVMSGGMPLPVMTLPCWAAPSRPLNYATDALRRTQPDQSLSSAGHLTQPSRLWDTRSRGTTPTRLGFQSPRNDFPANGAVNRRRPPVRHWEESDEAYLQSGSQLSSRRDRTDRPYYTTSVARWKRRTIVQTTVAELQGWFDSQIRRAASGAEPSSPSNNSNLGGFASIRGHKPSDRQPNRGRKHSRKQDQDSGEESNDSRSERKKSKILKTVESSGKRFACPFCKRYPEKYQLQKSCGQSSWPTVHRVK
jgi:hypothetical protein